MANGLEREDDHGSGGGFMLGLLTGTVLGAGLGMLLAPKSGSELRTQIGEQAASFGRAATGQLRRAGHAASSLAEKARGHGDHATGEAAAPDEAGTTPAADRS